VEIVMSSNRVFELGVVMAGAISAGAYTAGVMDFLMEALDAYEEAKLAPDWTGPVHDVRIPVMAGASAGGMTAAISALHAFHPLAHVWPGEAVPAPAANRLYSSWVRDISIQKLLETTDVDRRSKNPGLKSALCCDVLETIVKDAFVLTGSPEPRKWVGRGDDKSLRVMLTITNMRGVPYSFALFGAGATDRCGMLNHGDYLDFTVGIAPQASAVSQALDIRDTTGDGWSRFKIAALATGAFPGGLAPRVIERNTADYLSQKRVGYDDPDTNRFVPIGPDAAFNTGEDYEFVAVDGGAVDNEPLELARRYLADGGHNERDGDKANRAVVLISPFPSFRQPPGTDLDDEKLIHTLPRLFVTLMDQARFKPDELEKAANDKIFSRFMISPIRPAHGNAMALKYPIASGPLGGFSGFLHESFRRHDYLLGRRNAQAFLRFNFGLPQSNGLFDEFKKIRTPEEQDQWYVRNADNESGSVSAEAKGNLPPKLFTISGTSNDDKKEPGFPIIPLVPRLREAIEIGPDDMPKPEVVSRYDLRTRIRTRAEKVVATLVDVDLRSDTHRLMFLGPVVRFGARRYGARIISDKAIGLVEAALKDVAAAFP
jgi:hypothetical protein